MTERSERSVFVFLTLMGIGRRSSLRRDGRISGARLRGSGTCFARSSPTMWENLLMESKPERHAGVPGTLGGEAGAPVDGKLSVVVIVQSHRAERRDAGGMLFQRVPLLVFGYTGVMMMMMMMKSGHAEG